MYDVKTENLEGLDSEIKELKYFQKMYNELIDNDFKTKNATMSADMSKKTKKVLNRDYTSVLYSDWIEHHLSDILIFKDQGVLKDLVAKVFNSSALYSHIDELKKFIKLNIEKELKGNDGIVIYNIKGLKFFTYEE